MNKMKKTDFSISVLFVVGIILVINFFSYKILPFIRIDLTETKQYSISKISKKTVGELDDIVNIKAYFSGNLPSQILSLKQEVSDVLNEYEVFSNGKIRVEYIDPGTSEEMQRELYIAGIPQLTFEVFEKDKRQLVNGYFGIAVSYGDKIEAIPTIKREGAGLEYQLTTAIKKVISERIATIGVVSSNKTANLENEISTAYESLQELYTVNQIEIKADAEIPVNIDTLLVIGPKESFSDEQIKKMENFVNAGKSLILFVDGVRVEQGLVANKNNTGINKLLNKYGFSLRDELVADSRSGMASFSQGFMRFSTPYPFWPKVTKEGFNQNEVSVSSLETVIFPWASSIDVTSAQDDKTYSNLALTSSKSWTLSENFNIVPNNISAPSGDIKERVLAISVSGKANYDNVENKKDVFKGKIILVGDSDFILDNFLQQNPDNLTFFQNIVDSISLDNDLIAIRSKVVSSRPIKEDLSDGAKSAMRYVNVFGVTLVVVVFGMARYYARRKSKFVDEL